MKVINIIKKHIIDNGYDGLFNPNGYCACLVDSLVPCAECFDDCTPGYRSKCDCGEGCEFHITENKEATREIFAQFSNRSPLDTVAHHTGTSYSSPGERTGADEPDSNVPGDESA